MSPSDDVEVDRLHLAASAGDLAEVRRLIAAGEPVTRFDDLGATPLHYAVAGEHLEVARVLIDTGADVNAHDERVIGDTPLRHVAQSCSFETARLLIGAGADPTIPGWMGMSAIDVSRGRKRDEGRRVHALLQEAAGHSSR